jgi:hypothetical protein
VFTDAASAPYTANDGAVSPTSWLVGRVWRWLPDRHHWTALVRDDNHSVQFVRYGGGAAEAGAGKGAAELPRPPLGFVVSEGGGCGKAETGGEDAESGIVARLP